MKRELEGLQVSVLREQGCEIHGAPVVLPERERRGRPEEKGTTILPADVPADVRYERENVFHRAFANPVTGHGRRHESYANGVSRADEIGCHVADEPGRLRRVGDRPGFVSFRSTSGHQNSDQKQPDGANPTWIHPQLPMAYCGNIGLHSQRRTILYRPITIRRPILPGKTA